MKTLRILLGAVGLALASSAVHAATPVPVATGTPAATQTPLAAATASPAIRKVVGTSANYLKFYASGTCTVNPAAVNEGNSAIYTCSVIGAKSGDVVSLTRVYSNESTGYDSLRRDCLFLQSVAITADDTLTFRLTNRDNGALTQPCDNGALTFQYEVKRVNP